MRELLATLFSCQIVNQYDVSGVEEAASGPIVHVLKATKGLLAKTGEKAVAVFEADLGYIVTTPRSAILIGDDGAVLRKDLPTTDEDAFSGATALLAKQLKGTLINKLLDDAAKIKEAMKLADRIAASISASGGKKISLKAESISSELQVLLARVLPEDEAKRQLATLKSLMRTGAKAKGLSESQIDEMVLNTGYVDQGSVDIGGVKGSVYGPSLRFRTEDFIKVAPNYSIADFVIESALCAVLKGATGDALVAALRQELKSSPKIDALEVTLNESMLGLDESAAAVSFSKDGGVTSVSANDDVATLKKAYPAATIISSADAKKVRAAVNKGDVTAAVWKSLHVTPLSESAADDAEAADAAEGADEVATVVVVVDGLELRVGADGSGKLLAKITCDTDDETEVSDAEDELSDKADELGYEFVESTDEDLKAVQTEVLQLVLSHRDLADLPNLTANFDTAVDEGFDAAYASATALAAAVGVSLSEGLTARKHKRGRKPSGKTFRRMTKGKKTTIKPPVDVGPGARFGGRVAEGADVSPDDFKKNLKASAAPQIHQLTLNAKFEDDPVKKKAMLARIKALKARYESLVDELCEPIAERMGDTQPGALAKTDTDPATPTGGIQTGVNFEEWKDAADDKWVDGIRAMSVDEFTGHIATMAETTTLEKFTARVAALVEAFKSLPGKKDFAKKITAANPFIKRKMGKGVDIEKAMKEAEAEQAVFTFNRAQLGEFIAAATKAGADNDATVRLVGEDVHVALPKRIASKIAGFKATASAQ